MTSRRVGNLRRRWPRCSRAGGARVLGLIIALATMQWGPCAGALSPKDRRWADARSGISSEAPSGWTLSQRTGYADTVVLLVHPDGSRISVSAATTEKRDPNQLYQQNLPGLRAQGWEPSVIGTGPRESLVVDLGASGRPDRLRQLYLVREIPFGHQAIVVTLVSSGRTFSAHISALAQVMTGLTLEDPALPPAADRSRGSAGGQGGAPRALGAAGAGNVVPPR